MVQHRKAKIAKASPHVTNLQASKLCYAMLCQYFTGIKCRATGVAKKVLSGPFANLTVRQNFVRLRKAKIQAELCTFPLSTWLTAPRQKAMHSTHCNPQVGLCTVNGSHQWCDAHSSLYICICAHMHNCINSLYIVKFTRVSTVCCSYCS